MTSVGVLLILSKWGIVMFSRMQRSEIIIIYKWGINFHSKKILFKSSLKLIMHEPQNWLPGVKKKRNESRFHHWYRVVIRSVILTRGAPDTWQGAFGTKYSIFYSIADIILASYWVTKIKVHLPLMIFIQITWSRN